MPPHHKTPPSTFHLPPSNQGLISVATVLIVTAVALAVGLTFSSLTISEQQHAYFDQNSQVSFDASESCMEEAMIRLKRSSLYTGGSLQVGDYACSSVVTGAGSSRTVTASSTVLGFVRQITATTTLQGASLKLNNWTQYDGF